MKTKPATPRSFRVPIAIPHEQKIKIVAAYKKRQIALSTNNHTFDNKLYNDHQQQNSANNINSNTDTNVNANIASISPPIEQQKQPNINILRENTPLYDENQHKLEQMYVKGQSLRQELQSLNSVRFSLLWLLKKATTLETQRNHKSSHAVAPYIKALGKNKE